MKRIFIAFFLLLGIQNVVIAESSSNVSECDDFVERFIVIKQITITGNEYLDSDLIVQTSELPVDKKIYLTKELIKTVLKNIIFRIGVENVAVKVVDLDSSNVTIEIVVSEYPEIERINILGIKNGNEVLEAIKQKYPIKLKSNQISLIFNEIESFFKKNKDSQIHLFHNLDAIENSTKVILNVTVENTRKKQIESIIFSGNNNISKNKFLLSLNAINEHARFSLIKNFARQFHPKKFFSKQNLFLKKIVFKQIFNFFKNNVILFNTNLDSEKLFELKKKIIELYNSKGYLDAKILKCKVADRYDNYVNIHLLLNEGQLYKLRSISWVGNKIFDSSTLNTILSAPLGRVYNPVEIKNSLEDIMRENSIKSLYDDLGYLTFNASYKEIHIDNNQVDVEICCNEGSKFYIDKIILQNNVLTFDNIILRAIRTFPGNQYRKNDLLRSYREILMLNFFDTKKTQPVPISSAKEGFVDILYLIKEHPKFGFNLSASTSGRSFEAGASLSCNNISLLDLLKFKKPFGAGQSLSLDFKKGAEHLSGALEFIDPMISEKNPYLLSLGVGYSHSGSRLAKEEKDVIQGVNFHFLMGNNFNSVDYLSHNYGLCYKYSFYQNQNSILKTSCPDTKNEKKINGELHDIFLKYHLMYDSTNVRIFPSNGIKSLLTFNSTLPYSLLGIKKKLNDFVDINNILLPQYFQLVLDFCIRRPLFSSKFVCVVRSQGGITGDYSNNKEIFNRFVMGGTSDSENGLVSRKHIILRGHDDASIPVEIHCDKYEKVIGGLLYSKFAGEIFYPIIDENIISVIALIFIEAGNVWNKYEKFSILTLKPSVGFGFKVYVSAILNVALNFDFGYPLLSRGGNNTGMLFHFSVGMDLN